jgi:hypothetical protein
MRLLKDLASAAFAVAAFLLLLEGGLRLAGVRFSASLYQPELERGYSLRPNAEGWMTDEGENYVRINSDGMRDRERRIEAEPDTVRIAVVGSSGAAGLQVPLDRTFQAVAERKLNRALADAGKRVEVLNFGVPGYTLAHEYLTLKNHVWKYRPSIVVLANPTFAVMTATRELFPSDIFPYFEIENGELKADAGTRARRAPDQPKIYWKNRISDWTNVSYALLLGKNAAIRAPEEAAAMKRALLAQRPAAQTAGGATDNHRSVWPFLPDQPELKKSWTMLDAYFRAMKRNCDAHGAEFWIVTLDAEMAVHPDLKERAAFAGSLGIDTLYASDQRIERMAAADGIPVVSLGPVLGQYSAAHHVALHGFFNTAFNNGHWNPLGHELAGRAIARELLERSAVLRGP